MQAGWKECVHVNTARCEPTRDSRQITHSRSEGELFGRSARGRLRGPGSCEESGQIESRDVRGHSAHALGLVQSCGSNAGVQIGVSLLVFAATVRRWLGGPPPRPKAEDREDTDEKVFAGAVFAMSLG